MNDFRLSAAIVSFLDPSACAIFEARESHSKFHHPEPALPGEE
jgi:hypothetical protein